MSSEERARRERERRAAIERAINAKQKELDGVNAEIAKYEAILNALTESQTTLASYKADLETEINDVIVNYDVKDGTTWSGLEATKAWREMDFIKNKKDNYVQLRPQGVEMNNYAKMSSHWFGCSFFLSKTNLRDIYLGNKI